MTRWQTVHELKTKKLEFVLYKKAIIKSFDQLYTEINASSKKKEKKAYWRSMSESAGDLLLVA